jgi:ParB family chromosome partitioning protein
MRHDSHFVEEITSSRSESIGRVIDIGRIEPNPHQPRREFGDLSEMVASVKEKGILEPILVRSYEGKYQIIAGERRYQAARMAGLQRVPCIEVDVDTRGMLEISLIENLQRRDLTPFEESAAIQRLCDQFRYTHEEIARKLGKSRTVITEALSLNRMPEEIQQRCRQADINSKSMLLQIVRQPTVEEMHKLLDKISGDGLTREEARRYNKSEAGRRPPKHFTYRFKPDDRDYQFTIRFDRPDIDRREVVSALRELLTRPSGRGISRAESASSQTRPWWREDCCVRMRTELPKGVRSRRPRPFGGVRTRCPWRLALARSARIVEFHPSRPRAVGWGLARNLPPGLDDAAAGLERAKRSVFTGQKPTDRAGLHSGPLSATLCAPPWEGTRRASRGHQIAAAGAGQERSPRGSRRSRKLPVVAAATPTCRYEFT